MDTPPPSPLESAILTYFRQPNPAEMVDLFIAEPVGERWRAETVLTLPVFLALVLDQAPDQAERLVDAIRGGDAVKIEVVAQALNYAHLPNRLALMERLAGEAAAGQMDQEGADFLDFEPTHPVHVDMLWSAFFASGDPRYVDRIAALLHGWMHQSELGALLAVASKDPSVQDRALAGVLADAALWSLTVNARDTHEIHAALTAFAGRLDGLASAMAARILAGITSAQSSPEA